MITKYQMWITGNAEAEKLRIPVLPEKLTVSIGSNNTTVKVSELGEVVIKQARPAYQYSFKSFFPSVSFPGLSVSVYRSPMDCVRMLKRWLESKKPVHLIVTDVGLDSYCTIERFSYYEEGGDVGTIHYELTLKEYREVTVRNVQVAEDNTAEVEPTETRVDNTVPPKTYTVVAGDCLWNIAKQFYGDGSRYTVIQQANADLIAAHHGGPNMIWPGDVLTIPEAA